jgi:nucleoside 2-deoxyribosyltransferase
MKIFVSNKFQGENKRNLKEKLKEILSFLENSGHKTFNAFRDMTNWNARALPGGEAISWAFKTIKRCDTILCFIDSRDLSQGMLLEFGFAKALHKKTILLIAKSISSPTLEAIADKVIRFKSLKDLDKKLIKI